MQKHLFYLLIFIGCLSCDNSTNEGEPKLKVPSISTKIATDISSNSAISGGEKIIKGSSDIIEKGICWSTSNNPTINDDKILGGADTIDFASELTDLMPNTTYHIRAFATNDEGIGYGNEITFTTLEQSVFGEVEDIDGNLYKTVKIGNQTWMAENLRVSKFNNGTEILEVPDDKTWEINTHPMHSFKFDDEDFKVKHGALYNMYVVNLDLSSERNVCPTNWHVPTQNDWIILRDELGGQLVAGGKLKEAGFNTWWNPNEGATNETGFTAYSSSKRSPYGLYSSGGTYGNWWTSSTTELNGIKYHYSFQMEYIHAGLFPLLNNLGYYNTGYSIRCIKD